MRLLFKLMKDCRGATAVEYGLLIAIIGITLSIALSNYYGLMNNMFVGISNTVTSRTQ